jgi:hypothetical protein
MIRDVYPRSVFSLQLLVLVVGCAGGHQPRGEEDCDKQGSEPGPPRGHGRPSHQGRGRIRERGRGQDFLVTNAKCNKCLDKCWVSVCFLGLLDPEPLFRSTDPGLFIL